MLDWSALLITGNGLVEVEQGGIGLHVVLDRDDGDARSAATR